MGKTLELGRRIELCSMDQHCENISLGLYRREKGDLQQVSVHSYARGKNINGRIEFITNALAKLAGVVPDVDDPHWLQFECSGFHTRALKRCFLDVCKLEEGPPLPVKPLSVQDKKAGCLVSIVQHGSGVYEVTSAASDDRSIKRCEALAKGFAKVCEMQVDENKKNQIAFTCGCNHDDLMGMLMFRAQNVRAAMREEEMSATRGVLAAPSQQK